MDKEVTVGVDEFSLVFFYPIDDVCNDWQSTAYSMIQEFIYKADIEMLLGKVVEMHDKKPQAYSQAFTIENAPYYFTIALHETFVHMGILVRFSAHSWAVYQKRYFDFYGENINIGKFLSNIESPLYRYRLSRIDLTADYKNYDLSPHSIYSRLKDESLQVLDCNYRHSKRKISSVERDLVTESFYIGSRAENSQSLLRVYDKKSEQISNNGFRLDEALQCDSWVRFEASYRGNYAHQITEQLEHITDDVSVSQFIVSKICDRYRFYDPLNSCFTDFTNDLLKIIECSNFHALRCESPANNSLNKSIQHIIYGSGLFPLIYKISVIWGEKAVAEFWSILYEIYKKYHKKKLEINPQIRAWLRKNFLSLSQQSLSDCFVSVDLTKIDVAEIVNKISESDNPFTLTAINTSSNKNIVDTQIVSDEEFERTFYSKDME